MEYPVINQLRKSYSGIIRYVNSEKVNPNLIVRKAIGLEIIAIGEGFKVLATNMITSKIDNNFHIQYLQVIENHGRIIPKEKYIISKFVMYRDQLCHDIRNRESIVHDIVKIIEDNDMLKYDIKRFETLIEKFKHVDFVEEKVL